MRFRVLLIDGFNLVRRIYEAHPDPERAIDELCHNISRSVQRALVSLDPTHAVFVLEEHDTTWRHLLYPEYKAGRSPTPRALLEALPEVSEQLAGLGLRTFSLPNYEADDVIATLATGIVAADGEAIILSTDKSYQQLFQQGIRIVNHFDQSETFAADSIARYGCQIEQLCDYWALTGEPGNNIKGVPGIGKKTAATLLTQYPDLQSILNASSEDAPVRKVQEHATLANRCRQLVSLKRDVSLGITLKSFRISST